MQQIACVLPIIPSTRFSGNGKFHVYLSFELYYSCTKTLQHRIFNRVVTPINFKQLKSSHVVRAATKKE